MLADFSISSLQLQPGRNNALGDALSRIKEGLSSAEQSSMDILDIHVKYLIRGKIGG